MVAAIHKLKKWLTGKRRAPEKPVSLAPPPALLERYRRYKRLLAANSAILTMVTDLQVKMNEGFLFDMHYVRNACQRLGQEVEAMVAALAAMSGGRYQALEEARRLVEAKITRELAGAVLQPGPLVLPLAEVKEGQFFGAKAEKLGDLVRLGLPVPKGFAVSAYAQKLFFEQSGLEDFIREQIRRSHIRDLESLKIAGADIKERVMAEELPPELSQALDQELAALGPRVAVRSSALQEDSLFSFAGQFETLLNVPREKVKEAYKEVLASQFTPRVLYYCHTSGFAYQELAMGVAVMEMVDAATAGVLYTADPRQGGEATIINAVCGLGSLAVGGVVEPDIYRVENEEIVAREVGEKSHMHALAPEGGVLDLETPPDRRGACLDEQQVLALHNLGLTLEKHFGLPQDIEWALTTGGKLYLLQARPLRISRQLKTEYLPPKIKGAEVLLENGTIASRGAGAGPVHLLADDRLQEVPQGAVLVTRRALPEYGVVVGRVAAMICEAGSPTSHLATVLREAGVPAIFGAKGAFSLLKPGAMVTVDAYYGNVYAGRRGELLKPPPGDMVLHQSRAWKVLERVLKHITPLHLLDPRGENFRAENCTTYHDMTRFAHEKAMTELFHISAPDPEEDGTRRLSSHLPLEIHIIDLGGGLAPEAKNLAVVKPEHLRSRPMVAYWRGVEAVGWRGPKPVDLAGFMSVVMNAATDVNIRERLHEKNFAIIAADYLNLSNRLGFHFATIEAFLGVPEESYVSLTFYGGGAELERRRRRVRFLAKVLKHLDFRVELKEDSISGRIDGYDAPTLEEKLELLGRLMMVSKQLDMSMLSEESVEQHYRDFFAEIQETKK
ncbi:MAG: PEP/pyruvate-binding domain-containing protein [Syntrophales bacterium]|nr:PEP/pyruvate-binding domain-containing protein [Syntrophales bacterium]